MADTPKWWWTINSIWALAVAWVWLEYATNWKVTSTLIAVKDAVAWVLSWWQLPSLAKTLPVVWKLAPFAWIWAWIYYGQKKYKDIKTETWSTMKWLYRWIERWTMVFWVPMTLLWAAGLLSVPIAPTILITWLTLKWVRHWHKLLMNSISSLKKTPSYMSSLSWKAWAWVKKLKPKMKTASSSTPPTPTSTPPTT